MEAFFATIGAGLFLTVLGFPFAYGLKFPHLYATLNSLYTRVLSGLMFTASAVFLGYTIGAASTAYAVMDQGHITEKDVAALRESRTVITVWFMGTAFASLFYMFVLEVFRRAIIGPLLQERARNDE